MPHHSPVSTGLPRAAIAGIRASSLNWRGRTPFYACPIDTRFSYCAYLPASRRPGNLLVAVHGTMRGAEEMREAFVSFADETNSLIIAPLFPIGALDAHGDDEPAYKFVSWQAVRFDALLLAMVDDAQRRFDASTRPFQLVGFSGGAQFAQRFLLLHPARLRCVSIAAPGYVTLLDPTRGWWAGTADFKQVFGSEPALHEMRKVAIHLVVGAADTERQEIHVAPGSQLWVDGANDAGVDRVERTTALQKSLVAHGMRVAMDRVSNAGHELHGPVLESIVTFLRLDLAERAENGQ